MAGAAGSKFPKLVAAQWALESAWGKKPSGTNNFFGIKATDSESSTSKPTWEVINKRVDTSANFKNYETPQGSVNDLVNKWYKDFGNYQGVNRAGLQPKQQIYWFRKTTLQTLSMQLSLKIL